LCAQQSVALAGESPAAPSQGGCVDKRPSRTRRPRAAGNGEGRGAEAIANRSVMSALIRAGSLTAQEIPAERAPRQGVCGRHGGTGGASDLGRPRCVLEEGIHAAGMGPKSPTGRRGDKAESETARRYAARGQGLRSSEEPWRESRDWRRAVLGLAGVKRFGLGREEGPQGGSEGRGTRMSWAEEAR
jgi:hypothetical protein